MQRPNIRDVATGKWRGLLPQLGVASSFLTGRHCPCPMCGGKDRFRFTDFKAAGGWVCNQCGAGDGVALIERVNGWDFRRAVQEVEALAGDVRIEPPKPDRSQADMHSAMKSLYMASRAIEEGDFAWRYLNRRTGLSQFPSDLRRVDDLRYSGPPVSRHPGMIAVVRDAGGKAIQIHRTWLDFGGNKAMVAEPKQTMPGSIPKGCAIRLGDPGEVMGIAEGIETALSASVMWEIPVWSAINAGNMVAWRPPAGVRRVLIFGDNDLSFTGQHAAFALGSVLRVAKLEVAVHIPDRDGWDWNDVHRDEDPDLAAKGAA